MKTLLAALKSPMLTISLSRPHRANTIGLERIDEQDIKKSQPDLM